MKKLKSFLAVLLSLCIFTACTPNDTDGNDPADTSYNSTINIAYHTEKLTDCFQPMNICLSIPWDENGGELLENINFFKAMLENIYHFRAGENIPNENGIVAIDTYVNIASWNFPFEKETVRKALENSYGYNREDDTVYMSEGLGNVCESEIRNVNLVGENTLMVTYRYGIRDDYNEGDNNWYFSQYDTWVMLVKIESDGYTFLSNHKEGEGKIRDISHEGMMVVTDDRAIKAITVMYNQSSILLGKSWDVSEGMITFEGAGILGFNDALINFHRLQTGREMAGNVNGEYRAHVRDYIAQAVKYFPFSVHTLRRYYSSQMVYDRETDTVLAPDGYGNICWPEIQQIYSDGEYYVVESHYMWPEEGYDEFRTLLKKDDSGNFIFMANIRAKSHQ